MSLIAFGEKGYPKGGPFWSKSEVRDHKLLDLFSDPQKVISFIFIIFAVEAILAAGTGEGSLFRAYLCCSMRTGPAWTTTIERIVLVLW